MQCKIDAYCYVNYTSIMQMYINKYVCLSKKKIANGYQVITYCATKNKPSVYP